MDDGGREALLHFLKARNLDGVNLRNIPQTEALFEQKVRSLGSVEKWWYSKLDDALLPGQKHWEDTIRTDAVYDDYVKYAEKIGERHRATQIELGIALKKLAPERKRKLVRVHSSRPYHYLFPPLTACRKTFEELMRTGITWPRRRGR